MQIRCTGIWSAWIAGVVAWLGLAASAVGQLAITEVMASASTSLGSLFVLPGPDYFELTNFGDDPIDLTDYSFSDNHTESRVKKPFQGLVIQGHESILFFQVEGYRSVTNAADFCRWWWGDRDPSTCPRVIPYDGNGFSSSRDEVWLYDPDGRVVDMVSFGASVPGRSFVYDPDSGIFGMPCDRFSPDCFKAVLADDYGSPGTHTGPVPLSIVQPPLSQEVDGCGDVIFSVVAGGLPRPRGYQWQFNGSDIPGAVDPVLTLSDADPSANGAYRVVVDDGYEVIVSKEAWLTVNTQPRPPLILVPPEDITLIEGQSWEFTVLARGYPCLNYQWQENGLDLAGETARTLKIDNVALDQSGTVYTVNLWNDRGATNATVTLTVIKRPRLTITEVMSYPNDSITTAHQDWFELWNDGLTVVDLKGYRLWDEPRPENAFVISNSILLPPGQAVIFVSKMSPASFRKWWGEEILPPNLLIVTFTGFSLDYRGDVLYVWNEGGRGLDTVASTSTVEADPGVSLEWDPEESSCDEIFGCISSCRINSVAGIRGAFRAAQDGDIGSPGYLSNPRPRLLGLSHDKTGTTLRCRTVEGKWYRVYAQESLRGPRTALPGTYQATDSTITLRDATSAGRRQCFYLLEELP
jgi:Lamin Tail Domain